MFYSVARGTTPIVRYQTIGVANQIVPRFGFRPQSFDNFKSSALEVSTPVMFTFLADHFRIPGSSVREHPGRRAEVEPELATFGAFSRSMHSVVVNRLATDGIIRVCGNGGVLIRVSQAKGFQSFVKGFFQVLYHMHCNPILALRAMDLLAEVDRDPAGVECFPFEYERSKFIFVFFYSWLTRKRADGTEVTEGGHNEIHLICREKFA